MRDLRANELHRLRTSQLTRWVAAVAFALVSAVRWCRLRMGDEAVCLGTLRTTRPAGLRRASRRPVCQHDPDGAPAVRRTDEVEPIHESMTRSHNKIKRAF